MHQCVLPPYTNRVQTNPENPIKKVLRPAMNFVVSVTCAGSRWQLDQWRPVHVIMTAYHVLRTIPPKRLHSFH